MRKGASVVVRGRTLCGVCPVASSAWRAGPPAACHHPAPGPWSAWGVRAAGKGNPRLPVFFFPVMDHLGHALAAQLAHVRGQTAPDSAPARWCRGP
jgi:hypothetical protein